MSSTAQQQSFPTVQWQIRQNAEEYRDYLKDLTSWENDIKQKDKHAKKKPIRAQKLPPVRNADAEIPLTGGAAPVSAQKEASTEDDIALIERALIEKEKGNTFFKKGDYTRAIACYTKSFDLDPSNAVVPINSALCFLKLKKWSDAEEACTKGLGIDSKNVKGLWRRGVARRELGKLDEAELDLKLAAVLEPGNQAIRDELAKVEAKLK
ncbi:RNA polymerase II-associated protein 3, partial [Quaeritorhiza haematococci]